MYFGENLGDKAKGRSPKKQKLMIEVPYVAHQKVQVLSYNVIVISSPYRVPRLSYAFWENFGDEVKGRSTTKLKSLIEVPYVTNLKVQVLSYSMILISSAWHDPRPS